MFSVLAGATLRRLIYRCGIVSMTLAHFHANCQLTLTDLPVAQEVCEKNLRDHCSRARFFVWDWENDIPPSLVCPYDLVVVADCFYNHESAPLLAKALTQLGACSPDMFVVFSHKKRHGSEDVFYELIRGLQDIEHTRIHLGQVKREKEEEHENSVVDLHIMHWVGC